MSKPDFLACDWGTTNVRAWVIGASGEILLRKIFPFGVSRLAPGEAAAKFEYEVRPAMEAQNLPAFLCGMIGSDLGWTRVPYQRCPADLASLAQALFPVEEEPGTWIVPGVCGTGIGDAPDVMRGEETQILGWATREPSHLKGRHFVCHPGTHTKWAIVEDALLVRFITAMTGELFEVLRSHSVLRSDAASDNDEAFDEGLEAAADGSALAARLFTVRARVVTGLKAPQTSASYLSGLLIGAEVANLPHLLGVTAKEQITLLGDPKLCRLYARALLYEGIPTAVHDGEDSVIAGLRAVKAMRQG